MNLAYLHFGIRCWRSDTRLVRLADQVDVRIRVWGILAILIAAYTMEIILDKKAERMFSVGYFGLSISLAAAGFLWARCDRTASFRGNIR
jgi:hypothetical protein